MMYHGDTDTSVEDVTAQRYGHDVTDERLVTSFPAHLNEVGTAVVTEHGQAPIDAQVLAVPAADVSDQGATW